MLRIEEKSKDEEKIDEIVADEAVAETSNNKSNED